MNRKNTSFSGVDNFCRIQFCQTIFLSIISSWRPKINFINSEEFCLQILYTEAEQVENEDLIFVSFGLWLAVIQINLNHLYINAPSVSITMHPLPTTNFCSWFHMYPWCWSNHPDDLLYLRPFNFDDRSFFDMNIYCFSANKCLMLQLHNFSKFNS